MKTKQKHISVDISLIRNSKNNKDLGGTFKKNIVLFDKIKETKVIEATFNQSPKSSYCMLHIFDNVADFVSISKASGYGPINEDVALDLAIEQLNISLISAKKEDFVLKGGDIIQAKLLAIANEMGHKDVLVNQVGE